MKRASERDLQQILKENVADSQPEICDTTLSQLLNSGGHVRELLRHWDAQLRLLAPEPLRSHKNNVICFIDALRREAVSLGLSPDVSQAICSYYTCSLEAQASAAGIVEVTRVTLEHYLAKLRNSCAVAHSVAVTRTLHLIEQQLYLPCTPGGLAKTLQLHPAYLSGLFKKEMGVTLSTYIRRQKLEEARMLLQNESYSIAEIAARLCFCSSSYFCKNFREIYGSPPRAYLKSAE